MKDDFFKQTWVQVVSLLVSAVLGGLLVFFSGSFLDKIKEIDSLTLDMRLLEREVQLDKTAQANTNAEMGSLKSIIKELELTSRELKIIVDIIKKDPK